MSGVSFTLPTEEGSMPDQSELEFAITTVFGSQAAGVIAVLEEGGIEHVSEVLAFSSEEFADMADVSGTKLNKVQIKKLHCMQLWYHDQQTDDNEIWYSITYQDIAQKLVGMSKPQNAPYSAVYPSSSPQTPISNISYGNVSQASENLVNFKKSIKRSISDYKPLKDDKWFPTYQRQLLATAETHDVANALDPDYSPTTLDEAELFKSQNTFIYSVLTSTLLTPKSKKHVRKYQATKDGQSVYRDLVKDYMSGVSADVDGDWILGEILALDVSKKTTKSFEGFLDHFEHKILDLENVTDSTLPDKDKRRYLTSAIRSNGQLIGAASNARQIELTMQRIGNSQSELPFEEFYAIIRDTAINMDSQKQKNMSRMVNSQNTSYKPAQMGNSRTNQSQRTAQNSSRNKSSYRNSKWWVEPEKWRKMTEAEQEEHIRKYKEDKKKKLRSNNKASSTQHNSPIEQPAQQPPSFAQQLTSNRASKQSNSTIDVNGAKYSISSANVQYTVKQHNVCSFQGSLIDSGANGGLSGSDVRVLATSKQLVDVLGISKNALNDLSICTVAGYILTTEGPIIGVFHQYAHVGSGDTIHSVNQLASFGIKVDERPASVGGTQRIVTPEGFVIPLAIRGGLAYMDMRPPTEEEVKRLPHVTFTSDVPWDPFTLDGEGENLEVTSEEVDADEMDINCLRCIVEASPVGMPAQPVHVMQQIVKKAPDFNKLRPYFGWLNAKRIKATLKATTQWYKADSRLPMRKHFKTRFPAANVDRLNEQVNTDTFFASTPALDDGIVGHGGCTMVQLYVGRKSQVTEIFPMSTESEMHKTLSQFISLHGAPDCLFSDNAKAQIGNNVQDILRHYHIKQKTSEPHQQNQNYAERRIQDVKSTTNGVMDRTGTPECLWLLCMTYVVYLLNRMAVDSLDGRTPLEVAHNQRPDISSLLNFRWYEPVYYLANTDISFPDTQERHGRWVGVAEHSGDQLTYLVLDTETRKVVMRSCVRSAVNSPDPNCRAHLDSSEGENTARLPPLQSATDFIAQQSGLHSDEIQMPSFSPQELVGMPFLHQTTDGQIVKAQVERQIEDLVLEITKT